MDEWFRDIKYYEFASRSSGAFSASPEEHKPQNYYPKMLKELKDFLIELDSRDYPEKIQGSEFI